MQIDPATSALVIIDMQRDFCAPGGYAARAGLDVARLAAPVAAVSRLLAAARTAGLLVRGERGNDFIDELQPHPGEPVIDKPGYGAFHQTDLAQILANRGIATLLLCGVTTEVCVHSTLREAVDRGFECITVGDACAASDPALQAPALAMIGVEGGIFGRVADTAAVVAALRGVA